MTTYTPNTTDTTPEEARVTEYSRAFSIMLTVWHAYVDAERDVEDIASWSGDPAFSLWERDREAAEAGLMSCPQELHHMPICLPEDRPLESVAVLLGRMLDDDDVKFPRQLYREMTRSFFELYQVPGIGPIARHRNAQLIQARNLFDEMIRLSYFSYLPEGEPQLDELGLDALTFSG